jgi:hypothetical protein
MAFMLWQMAADNGSDLASRNIETLSEVITPEQKTQVDTLKQSWLQATP